MFGLVTGLFGGWAAKLALVLVVAIAAFGTGMYLEHKIAVGKAAEVQVELARQTAKILEENETLKSAVLERDAKLAAKDKVVRQIQRKKAQDVVKKTPSTPAFRGPDADRLRSLFD